MRPFGYFVHHQGRGHAERCAALVNALSRPVTVFCARPDIFPELRKDVTVLPIPSLFEEEEASPPAMDRIATPSTLHCAPLGWRSITSAMATMTRWWDEAAPALMISDVSAEVAQMARIASVPCVKVLQHGDRSDPGHMSAYEGCAGLLAPYHADLAPARWPGWLRGKTHFAPGLGIELRRHDKAAARRAIGVPEGDEMILVVSGGGGEGLPLAPLAMGARATPGAQWIVIGKMAAEWHATAAGNLRHDGWVDATDLYIAAADVVVASPGNTLCHQILASGTPWVVVPEWRYFDEQRDKAECLAREGLAHLERSYPATPHGWRAALDAARACDTARGAAMVDPDAAGRAARWLDDLAERLWHRPPAALAAE